MMPKVKYRLWSMFALIALVACKSNPSENASEDIAAPVVRVVYPQQKYHQQKLEFSGTLKPWREANLGTSIPGRVENIYFPQGSYVKQGDLIAQLSAEPAIMAHIEMQTLETDYQRVSRLKERGSITQQDFNHVEAQYKAARAKHDLMQKNTRIYAPFDGYLAEILVQEGENFFFLPAVKPGMSHAPGIVRLMQMQPMKVEFRLPENQVAVLDKISEVKVKTDAFPQKEFNARVHRMQPIVSQTSRTVPVELAIDNPARELMVGMFARISLTLQGENLVFVPRQALVEENGKTWVWMVDAREKAIRRAVETGIVHQGKVAIAPADTNERIIVAGFASLEEGVAVQVKE